MDSSTENTQEKLEKFQRYLEQDSENLMLTTTLVDLQLKLGCVEESVQLLLSGLQGNPESAELKSRLANIYTQQEKFDQAVGLYDELKSAGHDEPILDFNLSYLYMYQHQYQKAYDTLLSIVEHSQDIPPLLVLIARAAYHLGDVDKAAEYLDLFLMDHPNDAEALGLMAMLKLDDDKLDDADKFAQLAIAGNDQNYEALVALGTVELSSQNKEQALTFFSKATATNPLSGRAWAGLGITSMLDFKIAQAIEQLETAVIHMPNHIGTWHALAWCYLVDNNIDAAEQKFKTSLEIDNRFGETYGGLAMIETMRGNRDEAELLVRKALKLDKQSWSAWYVKSILASKDNQKLSDKILSRLLDTVPEGGKEPLKDTLSKYFIKARNKNINTDKSKR